MFTALSPGEPNSLVESGSIMLMRELLRESDHLSCISPQQVDPELALGAPALLPFPMTGTNRPIGLTMRADWMPTRAQQDFLDALRVATA